MRYKIYTHQGVLFWSAILFFIVRAEVDRSDRSLRVSASGRWLGSLSIHSYLNRVLSQWRYLQSNFLFNNFNFFRRAFPQAQPLCCFMSTSADAFIGLLFCSTGTLLFNWGYC